MYEYKMVEMETALFSRRGRGGEGLGRGSGAAAGYLENIVNDNTTEGWEFYRIDTFVEHQRGCLAVVTLDMLGKVEEHTVYVATFRRQREGGSEQVEAEES